MAYDKEYRKQYYLRNKEKEIEYSAKYRQQNQDKIKKDRKDNPDKHKSYNLKRDYGITIEDYNNLLKDQNHRCASCGVSTEELEANSEWKRHHKLVVDHCHTTGAIRGLLCNSCNTALGMVKEDISVLKGLMSYVERVCQPTVRLN